MKLLPEDKDLLNDKGLDEMQKTYAYKLAFNCFKALYWSVFAMSLIMLYIATAIEDSIIFAITAIVTELITSIVYIVFGAKASKVGALNPKFAKTMAKPSTITSYFALGIIYIAWFGSDFMEEGEIFYLFIGIYMLIFVGTFITMGFIAKKNNKIIENDEEEEKTE